MDDEDIFSRMDELAAGQRRQAYHNYTHNGNEGYYASGSYPQLDADDTAYPPAYGFQDEYVQQPLQLDDFGESRVVIEMTFTHKVQTRDSSINPTSTPAMARLLWVELDCHFYLQEGASLNLKICTSHLHSTRLVQPSNPTFLALYSILVRPLSQLRHRIDLQVQRFVYLSNTQSPCSIMVQQAGDHSTFNLKRMRKSLHRMSRSYQVTLSILDQHPGRHTHQEHRMFPRL